MIGRDQCPGENLEYGMIHYQLRCDDAHEFDGWFNDSAGFEKQAKRGLIECPVCGGTKVERALMAPAVSTREAPEPKPPAPVQQVLPPAPAGNLPDGPMPARMIAMLQRLRAEVERNCDYVGPAFAEEARKIHNGEAEARGIYGETTREEAEALADDGIDVHAIPWVPPADA
jgi:hypothetical protein